MKTIIVLLVVLAACSTVRPHKYYGNGNPDDNGKGSVIPAPPCPKNYLFSCQPKLAPVPCAPSSGGVIDYGYAGAHSEYVPTIAIAPYNYQGLTAQGLQYPKYLHHHH